MKSLFYINNIVPKRIIFNNSAVGSVYYNNNLIWSKELDDSLGLKFISTGSFDITAPSSSSSGYGIIWDGVMEYSQDYGDTWSTWDGNTITAGSVDGQYVLCFRGTNNTKVAEKSNTIDSSLTYRKGLEVNTSTDIRCVGNIEVLLDYQSVLDGNHPTMAENCFNSLFKNWNYLIEAPRLPATTLAPGCYNHMFYKTTKLQQPPELPATNLDASCYEGMFRECGITEAPVLPALTMYERSYRTMFLGCTKLTTAPILPATALNKDCYTLMFSDCTNLTEAPVLPATQMAESCYYGMFSGCTKLTTAPALPSTKLAQSCYYDMFSGCTNLKIASALPATTLAVSCYSYMFNGCKYLSTIPALPATKLPSMCYYGMFDDAANYTLAKWGGLQISETQTTECPNEYRLPSSGTITSYVSSSGRESLAYMFNTITPTINTTYYTNATVV